VAVAEMVKSLMAQGLVRDEGDARGMRLFWNSDPACPACPTVSPESGHSSVSRVPTPEGGNGDTVAPADAFPEWLATAAVEA
jgi:hypothetical protein